ncbi:MAG TPA: DUF4214 domain-containing protein, partial [Gemmataceae bacterium]|nr:DUF4214 domain-containing protein [Gemmataceae bacterium]
MPPSFSRFLRNLRQHLNAPRGRSADRESKSPLPRFRPCLERLEDLTLLSALDITGGSLTYTASVGVDNNLTITNTGGNYTFQDTAETISLSGGAVAAHWSAVNANTVTGPTSSVTTDFTVNLLNGADQLNINGAISGLSGTVALQSGQNITFNSSSGISTTGNVFLTASTGAITETVIGTAVAAVDAALSAATGIGSTGNPISTSVSGLVAQNTTAGGIFIGNTDAVLTVGYTGDPFQGIQDTGAATDPISLTNNATIDVTMNSEANEIISAPGNVTVTATGSSSDIVTGESQNLVGVGANTALWGSIVSVNGAMDLDAGGNLVLGTTVGGSAAEGDVTSGNNLTLNAGGNITVDAGSIISAAGAITGTAVGNISLLKQIAGQGSIQSNDTAILLITGAGGTFTADTGAHADVESFGGNITVVADNFVLDDADSIDATTGLGSGADIVTLTTATAGRTIFLGQDISGDLSLTDSDLSTINADALLRIGSNSTVPGGAAPANTGGIILDNGALGAIGSSSAGHWNNTLSLVTDGSISDDSGAGTIVVPDLALQAATSLAGFAISLTNSANGVSNLAASVSNGGFQFTNDGAITITGPIDGVSGINDTSSDGITVSTVDGDITISQDIASGGGPITLVAGTVNGDHTITNEAAISTSGSSSTIILRADLQALQPGSTITATDGTVNLRADTNGVGIGLGSTAPGLNFSQAELNTITADTLDFTSFADIDLDGALTLTQVQTLILEASIGAVVNNSGADPELTVTNLAIAVKSGIAADIEVTNLDFDNTSSGVVDIKNTGSLTIADLDSLGSATSSGAITVSTTGAMTLDVGVGSTGTGDITLEANQGGTGANDFTQEAGAGISTGSTDADAVVITVNTAGGGAGAAILNEGVGSGDGGTITITTAPGGNTMGGSITQAADKNISTGTGGSVVLSTGTAVASSIGTAAIALETTTANVTAIAGSGGAILFDFESGNFAVSATGAGDIVMSAYGGINLSGPVSSGTGTIAIAAAFGGSGGDFTQSAGGTITTGNTSTNAVEIAVNDIPGFTSSAILGADITTGAGGTILVDTNNGVTTGGSITQTAGTLSSGAGGTVKLQTPGGGASGIGASGAPIQISAGNVTAAAGSGGAFIDDALAANFKATAAGAGEIMLTDAAAMTVNGTVSTGSGNIILTATDNIAVSGGFTINTTGGLALSAANGIGSSTTPIATEVGNLVALNTTSGGTFVSNTGELTIGFSGDPFQGVEDQGNDDPIVLDNAGTLNITTSGEAVLANGSGPVTITTTAGGDIVTGGNQAAVNIGGDSSLATLDAAGNLTFGVNGESGSVAGAGPLVLIAGENITLDEGSTAQGFGPGNGVTATAGGNITLQATTVGGASIFTASPNGSIGAISLTTGPGGVFTLDSGAGGGIDATQSFGNPGVPAGNITISADSMIIEGPITTDSAGIVTLQQASTTTRNIDLGTASAGNLGLTDAELDQVTAGILRVGRGDNAGSITVTASIDSLGSYTTLSLITGGSITGPGQIVVPNLALQAAAGSGGDAVDLENAANGVNDLAANVSGGDFNFVNGQTLTITGPIDGLTGLTDDAAHLTVTAPTINLAADVSNAIDSAFEGAVTLAADVTVTSTSNSDITFGGTVESPGTAFSLNVVSGGTVIFDGDVGGDGNPLASLSDSADGTTLITSGSILTTGAQSYGSVSNASTATTLTSSGNQLIGIAADIAPGGIGSLGTLALATGVGTTLTPANVLNVDLDSAAGSDQLVSDGGAIDLGGATLDINVVASAFGDSYTIVSAQSGGAISGTFAGLPNGTVFEVGGNTFLITYTPTSVTLLEGEQPAITSANIAHAVVFSADSFTVTATGFPMPTLSLTGTLPAGMSFDSATGVLSGTPNTPKAFGTFPLTITASNGVGTDATQNFELEVSGIPAYAMTPNERYIAQVYLDLLHRVVDEPGMENWSGQLDAGVAAKEVILEIEQCSLNEYQTLVVQNLYMKYLGRPADPGGLQQWVSFLDGG